jgi:hypothetical protein
MKWVERLQWAARTRRVAIFLRVLSVFCLLGALSHLGGILGLVGPPLQSKPLLFHIGDSVLLPTNLVLAWGLWKKRPWAVFGWLAAVVLLQAIPILFLLVTDAFETDPTQRRTFYGMLATHVTLVAIFLLLLPKKTSDQAFDPIEPAGQNEAGNAL